MPPWCFSRQWADAPAAAAARRRRSTAGKSSASRNRTWSSPSQMCSTPSPMNVANVSLAEGGATKLRRALRESARKTAVVRPILTSAR